MKRIISWCLVVSVLAVAPISSACVGKTIHLGITGAVSERLLAEMSSILITERTGSSVKIDVYKDSKELYSAVKQGKVNVIFENPGRAAEIVGKPTGSSFNQIKSEYKTKLNLTWLEQIGGSLKFAPVLTADTLANYPALPKLLNKLSGALVNDTYAKLLKSAESSEKSKKTAREFLKGKKLI